MKIRILKTDGSVEIKEVDGSATANDIVRIGTELRKNDVSVAAVRCEIEKYTWVGWANDLHMEAIAKAERENQIW